MAKVMIQVVKRDEREQTSGISRIEYLAWAIRADGMWVVVPC